MNQKYLVISDNHGNIPNMNNVIRKFSGKVSGLIHCGDLEVPPEYLMEMVDCPVWLATGNCDFIYDRDPETVFDLGPHRALVTHGHRCDIRWGSEGILEHARELGVDVVFFGHSHRPAHLYFREDDISCFNPGSIALPRQFDPYAPTFLLIDLDDDGQITPTFCYLGRMGKTIHSFEVPRDVI